MFNKVFSGVTWFYSKVDGYFFCEAEDEQARASFITEMAIVVGIGLISNLFVFM